MRLQRKKSLGLLVAGALILGVVAWCAPHLLALGPHYFDDNSSDAGNECDIGTSTAANPAQDDPACDSDRLFTQVGQGQHAPHAVVQLGAYYKLPVKPDGSLDTANFPTGQVSLTINGVNFCPAAATGPNTNDTDLNGYYSPDGNGNVSDLYGKAVTDYYVGSEPVEYGFARSANATGCDSTSQYYNRVVTLKPSDFVAVDPDQLPGEFYVPVKVIMDPAIYRRGSAGNRLVCDDSHNLNNCVGIWNGFVLHETGGIYNNVIATLAYSGECSGNTGSCVSVRTSLKTPDNLVYRIRFGSDCSITQATPETVHFYDVDYPANSPIRLRIHDVTNNEWLPHSGGSGWGTGKPSFDESKLAVRGNDANSQIGFTALPKHKYVLEILNVQPVRVMQYSSPFPGIFYEETCTTPPTPKPTCQATVTPSFIDPSIQARLNIAGVSPTVPASWRFAVTSGAGSGKSTTVSSANENVNATIPLGTFPLGNYSGQVEVTTTNSSGVTSLPGHCSFNFDVGAMPYLSVWGGDAEAGVYAANGSPLCTTVDSSGFVGWNNDGDGNYAGAGTQMAVVALGDVQHFVSAVGGNDPGKLVFANTNDVASGTTYGGQFGEPGASCDFIGDTTGAQTSLPGGTYNNPQFTGIKTIYVKNQDVYIDGPIVYKDDGTTWTKPADIPSFKLVVVGGDIYVQHDVSELDGLYIAEPKTDASGNATGGTIYTCATQNGDGTFSDIGLDDPDFYTYCNHKLTVYGAFVAKRVSFGRSTGTLGSAAPSDTYKNNAAAENFIFSPEMWIPNTIDQGRIKYNSILGLPPVL